MSLGDRVIVGAGSVVTKSFSEDLIIAGNPAKIVKNLDQNRFVTRETLFQNYEELGLYMNEVYRTTLTGNTFFHWLKTLIIPEKND